MRDERERVKHILQFNNSQLKQIFSNFIFKNEFKNVDFLSKSSYLLTPHILQAEGNPIK